jgi:hypothetical protein
MKYIEGRDSRDIMRHREGNVFALRSEVAGLFGRTFRGFLACGGIFALCASLQACSSDPSWPSAGQISDLTHILTPEERQKAVEQLEKNDPNSAANQSKPQDKPAQ